MTLKFKTDDIIATLGPSPTGTHVLTITGTLLDGTPIEGQDCVVIVPFGGGRKHLAPVGDRNRTERLGRGQDTQSDTLQRSN